MTFLLQGVDTNSSAYLAGQTAGKALVVVIAIAVAIRIYKWSRNRSV
jgi:hypothetical protein